jgi:hemerythrin
VNLAKHAQAHFTQEEALMKTVEFPELHMHQKSHARLNKDLHAILVKMRKGETPTARQLYSMLKGWWVGHVEIEDMKYAAWIKERQQRGELTDINTMPITSPGAKVGAI